MRLIDTHTVVIQRNKKSKCIVVHKDKLKPCLTDEGNESDTRPLRNVDLPVETTTQPISDEVSDRGHDHAHAVNEHHTGIQSYRSDPTLYTDDRNIMDRPKRNVQQPAYLHNFHVFVFL